MIGDPPGPSWNVAPRQQVRVVLDRSPADRDRVPGGNSASEAVGGVERQLRTVQWGLVPSWSKDQKIGNKLLCTMQPAPRRSPKAGVPSGGRTPPLPGPRRLLLRMGSRRRRKAALLPALRLSGAGHGRPVRAVVRPAETPTTPPGEIHHRRTVVLPADLIDDWLNPGSTDMGKARDLLGRYPEPNDAARLGQPQGQQCPQQRARIFRTRPHLNCEQAVRLVEPGPGRVTWHVAGRACGRGRPAPTVVLQQRGTRGRPLGAAAVAWLLLIGVVPPGA